MIWDKKYLSGTPYYSCYQTIGQEHDPDLAFIYCGNMLELHLIMCNHSQNWNIFQLSIFLVMKIYWLIDPASTRRHSNSLPFLPFLHFLTWKAASRLSIGMFGPMPDEAVPFSDEVIACYLSTCCSTSNWSRCQSIWKKYQIISLHKAYMSTSKVTDRGCGVGVIQSCGNEPGVRVNQTASTLTPERFVWVCDVVYLCRGEFACMF